MLAYPKIISRTNGKLTPNNKHILLYLYNITCELTFAPRKGGGQNTYSSIYESHQFLSTFYAKRLYVILCQIAVLSFINFIIYQFYHLSISSSWSLLFPSYRYSHKKMGHHTVVYYLLFIIYLLCLLFLHFH